MPVKNNLEHSLYVKNLYHNAGRIIRDKLFDKYSAYIDYISAYIISAEYFRINCIYDPIGAFFDAVCHMIIKQFSDNKDIVIYQIMSPHHKKDVICGLSVIHNHTAYATLYNMNVCKSIKLYTIHFSEKDIGMLELSDNLFKMSKTIQQKQL